MKIVWVSNYHAQPTGYGTIARHVIPHVQHNSHHQMVEFAVSGVARCLPGEWNGVKTYGCTGHGGKFGVGDWKIVQDIEKPDIWLLNFDAWAGGSAVTQAGIKYAIYPPIDHDPLPPPWYPSLKSAVEIVPYCKFGERVIREGLGRVYPIVKPIPHGVDTKIFRPIEVSKTEIFARETPQDAFVVGIFKNNHGTRAKYEVQLEAFRMFVEQVRDERVRLYLHTNKAGYQTFDITELVRRFDLTKYVYMISPQLYEYGLPDEELALTYNACDVILNAVAGEGWGLPIIEAFACGKPVIGVGFSSMPELLLGKEGEIWKKKIGPEFIETERGWLVPISGDEYTLGKRSKRRVFKPEDIAAALVDAYEHPDKRKEMGERAHKWVQKFDWKHVGDEWIRYFDRLEKKVAQKKYTWKHVDPKPVGKNKTACVVFSFNRPAYLVQTLDSLLNNTKADKCDWYFWQDGWKNGKSDRLKYTTPEGEQENKKLVGQCLDILNGVPFKRKKIVTHEYNVCIGQQVQEAKEQLFKKYDKVIFFDDDHIVSKDYIDILLRLHEQFPDAVVGAQATESKNIPKDAKLDEVAVTLKQSPQANVRPGRWRWIAYLLPRSVYEATKEGMEEYMKFIGPNYRDLPHLAVSLKWHVSTSGFDGVMDALLDKKKIRRIATVIPRGRYIGEIGIFTRPSWYKAMGFAQNLRYEFEKEPKKFRIRAVYDEKK